MIELKPATPTQSCDNCAAQQGRHYCLVHSQQVKNMDMLRCDEWRPEPEETVADGEGPQCPRCHAIYTADGPEYYDEHKGLRMTCTCGTKLFIQPETSTTWTTRVEPA